MNIALLRQYWREAPYYLRRELHNFTRYPEVGHNKGYIVGYLAALHDTQQLGDDAYRFWLIYSNYPHPEVLDLYKQGNK